MTLTVHKQTLDVSDSQFVTFPKGFTFLKIDTQREDTCVWYLCNPDEKNKVTRQIKIHGTGHPIQDNILQKFDYMGTFQLMEGMLIFHAFISKDDYRIDGQ